MTSCFLMPLGAPHYHSYESENKDLKVNVFCTPRSKTYHFSYNEKSKIEGCSDVFTEKQCVYFEIDDFFDDKKFQKTIRINDRKFHKLFEVDTLKIKIDNSEEIINLFPVN